MKTWMNVIAAATALAASTTLNAQTSVQEVSTSSFIDGQQVNTGHLSQGRYVTSQTSSFDSLSLTNGGNFAYSYSDHATGQLGALASTSASGGAAATAWMDEGLKFQVLGATNSTITPITLLASLHTTTPDQAVFFGLLFNGGNIQQSGLFTRPDNGFGGSGFSSFTTWLEGTTRFFSATYNLIGTAPSAYLRMDLRTSAQGGAVADFSHTAGISFLLPSNVSFTSQSGQFLTAVSAVPEPSTWAMMLVGFAATGFAMRRRRSKNALVAMA